MKQTVVALVLCLAMVGLMAVPAVAAAGNGNGASKADILRPGDGTVVGFAVFNTNGNGGINVEVAVWNLPEGIYRLMVQAPSGPPPEYLGWLVVGADGEGNAHVQLADLVVEPGATTIPCTVRINPNANPSLDVAHVEPAQDLYHSSSDLPQLRARLASSPLPGPSLQPQMVTRGCPQGSAE